MYQQDAANTANGTQLFACAKCNDRHPFEELSPGHQLCKSCKASHQTIKCHYCRSEFYHEVNRKSGSTCKKCEQSLIQHGKPKACAYCNLIAAFIGSKCQRCAYSENKYGPPLTCENCKQKSAFDRNDPESKKKVEGKLLCWLCTMSYKRSVAKAKHKEALLKSSFGSRHRNEVDSQSKQHHGKSNGHKNSINTLPTSGSSSSLNHHKSSHRHSGSSSSNHHRESSSSKKMRMDLSLSNGHLSSMTSSSSASYSDTRFLDSASSDHALLVNQLKEQLANLNKKLQAKEKELLSKDQQIASLKSNNAREQRDLREKITSLKRETEEKQNEMQMKLISLQKQYISMTRGKKVNTQPEKIEIPSIS